MTVDLILSSKQKSNLEMGYCCLNMYLRDLGIFCSRTCRLETIKRQSISYSYQLAHQNLKDLACILRWNHENGINLYRMSSEMFPFATHPDYYQSYNLKQFQTTLESIGKLAKQYQQRLTFHPGQYNQLTSHRDSVVEKAVIDIDFHCKIMDMMKLDKQGVIVIHGGSKQDGQQVALARFVANFSKLSPSAQKRLVLENCELAYSIEDLLPMCQMLSIPIVIDYHHHNINPGTKDLMDSTHLVLDIWRKRGITPLFHLSESKPEIQPTDNVTLRRAHSDYITQLPKELLKVLESEKISLDIEAKMKEQAVLVLYHNYKLCPVDTKYLWNISTSFTTHSQLTTTHKQ
ncbi:MAG: UV DNA damage repair endonuclease UvsE [Proteobacteria bacterium]|nr:UV DNA damage repair endonuclease UvsE [Pseudomonadota bacterium]NBP14419.1 UV DNA damage repair endonuclease UvsE [bacterium]